MNQNEQNKVFLPDLSPKIKAKKRLEKLIKETQETLKREKNEIRDILNKWWEKKVDKFSEVLKQIEELEKKHGYKIIKTYQQHLAELKLSNQKRKEI